VLGGAGLFLATAPIAQPDPETLRATLSLPEAQRALADAKQQSAVAAERASRLESATEAAQNEVAKTQARAAAVAARVQAAEADINAAEAQIAIIDDQRRAQRAALAAKQGPTTRLVAALQMLGLRPPALALVQPGSINDLVHLRAVLANVGPAIDARTAALRRDVMRGNTLRREADAALAALANGQRNLVAQRSALAGLAAERRRAADVLAGSAMIEQDRAMAMGEEARDIGDLMGRISDAASLSAQLASLSGPVLRPSRPGDPRPLPAEEAASAGQAPYRLPVVGAIVAGLGEVSDAGVRARGLTIATRAGAQVVAPTGGRIAYSGAYRGYGGIVIIDHGRGWTTLVTGLAVLEAKVGEPVDQGSPIGKAGANRPTVTVELRRNGQPIDITRLVG
jgi:murein hydrolase activator